MYEGFSSPSVKQDFGIERHGHQLPPPFYPAQFQQPLEPVTPVELEEDTTRSQTSTLFPHQLEHTIIFGGYPESDHSSPTVPLSANSNGFPQPTPPSEITSSPTHSDYQGYGHTHHVAIPSVPPEECSPPYYLTDAEHVYIPTEYNYNGIPFHYKHLTAFDRGPQPPFTPSATPFNDQATQNLNPNPASLPNGQSGLDQPPLEFVDNEVSDHKYPKSLLSHVCDHFNRQEYADCELEIQIDGESATIMVHSLLISQSTTLRKIIKSVPTASSGLRSILLLQLKDNFVTIPAIIAALQVCYGVTALDAFKIFSLDPTSIPRGIDMARFEDTKIEYQMNNILAYLAAGCILDLWNVSHCGTLNAVMFMSLEALEKVLSFSLDGLTRLQDTTKIKKVINAIADRTLNHDDGGTYSPYSNQILQTAIDYIVTSLSDYFTLDKCAPTYSSLSPFPAVSSPDSTRSSSKSGLNLIQFGDFPSERIEAPTREDTLLSSCLLSIPFVLLKHILDHLDQTISQRLSKLIISERERRRLANVKIWMQAESHSERDLPELSHWEESICSDDSHHTIERGWKPVRELIGRQD